MPILELFIITVVLVLFVVLALSVRMLLTKKGEFRGGSCQSHPDGLKDQGIGCGCGSHSCSN
jgi:predicted secreted protein